MNKGHYMNYDFKTWRLLVFDSDEMKLIDEYKLSLIHVANFNVNCLFFLDLAKGWIGFFG